jgi:hypothetical protein
MLRGKFKACIRKEESSKINDFSFFFKTMGGGW